MIKLACPLILAAAAICIQPVAADTYPRQPGVDAQHYVFYLALSDATDEIQGEATAEILFTRDGLGEFALDLASAVNGKGMAVTSVTSANAPVAYAHNADRLVITLAPPSKAGERRHFTIKYHGVPNVFRNAAGLSIAKNKYGERTFFSMNWPDKARQWLPIIDHPYDKATSEFIVTAPSQYQVVANGLLQEETDLPDGRRLTHWKQSVPISSWLNAIGVAQFASRHFGRAAGVPLETWVYHQDRDNGILTFEEPTRQAIEFYNDHIGPYPYEKLADVIAAGLGGGTEHASEIFYGERTIGTRPATGLVAHEVAHQWFGDSVTEKDWDDVWLSEGFATYFTLLTSEHYDGRDAFVRGLKSSRDRIFTLEKASPTTAVLHNNLSDMSKVLNQIVYQKGGWTLHMLRAQIGTEQFWAGIREYYRRYRDSNASTDDFRKVMEETSGANLQWFFEQWLKRPGSPIVEGGWRYNAGTKKVEIDLAQTQAGDAYRLPMEVAVGAKLEKIEMTQKQQHFEFAADAEPATVALDPNVWVLMQVHFEKK